MLTARFFLSANAASPQSKAFVSVESKFEAMSPLESHLWKSSISGYASSHLIGMGLGQVAFHKQEPAMEKQATSTRSDTTLLLFLGIECQAELPYTFLKKTDVGRPQQKFYGSCGSQTAVGLLGWSGLFRGATKLGACNGWVPELVKASPGPKSAGQDFLRRQCTLKWATKRKLRGKFAVTVCSGSRGPSVSFRN